MRRGRHDAGHDLLQPGGAVLLHPADVDGPGQGEDDDTVELLAVAVQRVAGLGRAGHGRRLGRADLAVAEPGDEPEGGGLDGEVELGVVVEDEVGGELVEVGEEGEAVVGLDLVEPVGEDLQQGVVEDCWANTFGSSWFRKPLMPSTAFSPTEQCESTANRI